MIRQKGKQVFCVAQVGDELWDSTATWLDGSELRTRVQYVLGSGAQLAFGEMVVDQASLSGRWERMCHVPLSPLAMTERRQPRPGVHDHFPRGIRK